MTLQIIECEQRSLEWYYARAGIPTMSQAKAVMAKSKEDGTAANSATRLTYMEKLCGERVSGEPMESYDNEDMARGRDQEGETRDLYEFLRGPVTLVGFMRDGELAGGVGCSPDGLVGESGMVEFKSAAAHVLVSIMRKGKLPAAHKWQLQGSLWVAQREWIDLMVYNPKFPRPFIERAYRDERAISELASETARFNDELADIVEKVRRYGAPSTLMADLAASVAA